MNSIVIRELNYTYGTHKVLHNINLEIEESTFVSVVGPNGAGKSTFLKILLGLIRDYTGYAEILGDLPHRTDPKQIAYVPQMKTLERTFPVVPSELIYTGLHSKWPLVISKSDKEKAENALKLVGAEHLIGKQLRHLSGGELQRVYLARAMARNAKVLLLDEPATGIDFKGEQDLHKIIDNYKSKSKATIVMITHDWESAYHHSDRVLLINKKVVCYNCPEKAFKEEFMREAFGHIGHDHDIVFGSIEHRH